MTDRTANTVLQVRENGLVSQSGGLLLAETLRATGLGQGLARWRAPRAVHDPGKRSAGAIKDSGSDRRRSAWSNRGCWPI
jgi:hypothetical protein